MNFAEGSTVLLREVVDGRVRSARPLRVVAHEDTATVGYLVPRSTVAWPRLLSGAQSQTPDQGWLLTLESWFGPGALFVLAPTAGYAVVLFFDAARAEPMGAKVDFMRPLRPSALGWDTVDHAFDLVAGPPLAQWTPKDVDDLAQLARVGLLMGDDLLAFEVARDAVTTTLSRGGSVVDPRWGRWRPDPTWPPLELPAGWEDVGAKDAGSGRVAARARFRSAQGIRVLDDAGRTWLDLDLGGGVLVHGHAPPDVVEAVARQVPLGWALGAHHPAVEALVGRLATLGGSLRWWSGPRPGVAVDLTAALVTGWPPPPAEVGWVGAALFGGLSDPSAGVVVGSEQALASLEETAQGPTAAPAPSAVTAVAALATLDLSAQPERVAATMARADRIRRHTGWGGQGASLARPRGTATPAGVLLPNHGVGLLASGTTDAEEADLVERLSATVRP